MTESKFRRGEIVRISAPTNIHLICGLDENSYVRIVRVERDEPYVSHMDGRGLIPAPVRTIRKLSPLEQLAAEGE